MRCSLVLLDNDDNVLAELTEDQFITQLKKYLTKVHFSFNYVYNLWSLIKQIFRLTTVDKNLSFNDQQINQVINDVLQDFKGQSIKAHFSILDKARKTKLTALQKAQKAQKALPEYEGNPL